MELLVIKLQEVYILDEKKITYWVFFLLMCQINIELNAKLMIDSNLNNNAHNSAGNALSSTFSLAWTPEEGTSGNRRLVRGWTGAPNKPAPEDIGATWSQTTIL